MTNTTILAIDPGYDRVGWAVGRVERAASKPTVLDCGCIQTDKTATRSERYLQIDREITALIERLQPNQLVIESLFFFKNKTTALHVAEARGVILSAGLRQGLAFFEYTPLQIKQTVTGYGRADKKALDHMIGLQLGVDTSQLVDDAVDALGLLLTHSIVGRFTSKLPPKR